MSDLDADDESASHQPNSSESIPAPIIVLIGGLVVLALVGGPTMILHGLAYDRVAKVIVTSGIGLVLFLTGIATVLATIQYWQQESKEVDA